MRVIYRKKTGERTSEREKAETEEREIMKRMRDV